MAACPLRSRCRQGSAPHLHLLPHCRADADLTLLSKPPPPPGAFHGKVVWIIGASQGLGEELAKYWAAAGAKLILSSRSLEKLEVMEWEWGVWGLGG